MQDAVIRQYLSCQTWRNGLLLDATGALFGLASLSILPISVAQPIFCNGLVLLSLYSHFHSRNSLDGASGSPLGSDSQAPFCSRYRSSPVTGRRRTYAGSRSSLAWCCFWWCLSSPRFS